MPTSTAAISAHGTSEPVATDMTAPVTSRMMPGTAWWTWTPGARHVVLEGPLAGPDHARDGARRHERDDEGDEAQEQGEAVVGDDLAVEPTSHGRMVPLRRCLGRLRAGARRAG